MKTKKIPVSAQKPQSGADLNLWFEQQANQSLLRFITCGSVDDGKSTLIGRLLWESSQIMFGHAGMPAARFHQHSRVPVRVRKPGAFRPLEWIRYRGDCG